MDVSQHNELTKCIHLCDRLLQEAELDRERAAACMNGEILNAFMRSNEALKEEVSDIRRRLRSMLQ